MWWESIQNVESFLVIGYSASISDQQISCLDKPFSFSLQPSSAKLKTEVTAGSATNAWVINLPTLTNNGSQYFMSLCYVWVTCRQNIKPSKMLCFNNRVNKGQQGLKRSILNKLNLRTTIEIRHTDHILFITKNTSKQIHLMSNVQILQQQNEGNSEWGLILNSKHISVLLLSTEYLPITPFQTFFWNLPSLVLHGTRLQINANKLLLSIFKKSCKDTELYLK